MVLKAFSETVDNTVLSATNEAMMKTLLSLFAVSGIMQHLGEFMLVSLARAWPNDITNYVC